MRRAPHHAALAPQIALVTVLTIAGGGCRGCAPRREAPRDGETTVAQDFEGSPSVNTWPRNAAGKAEVSTAWHAEGERSLRIDPGVLASFTDLALHDFTGYTTLTFDVHNPGNKTETETETETETARLTFELQDNHETLRDRHQRSLGVTPGDTRVELALEGGLWRGEENRPYRGDVKTPLDLSRVTRMAFGNHGRAPLFIDRVALERRPRLASDGAFAFDFGPEGSQIMTGTRGVSEATRFTPERGFGLLGRDAKAGIQPMSYPTPLLGDGLALGDEGFRVDLKGGRYLGWVAFERGGFWMREATGYARAELSANGEVVHAHDFTPAGPSFLFEDTEITDPAAIEERLVRPAAAIARFTFDARPGSNVFTLATPSRRGPKLRLAGLVLAPDTPEGRAFLDAHDALESKAIRGAFAPWDRGRRGEGRRVPEADLVVEPRAPGAQVYPRDLPEHPRGAPLGELIAVLGQPLTVHLAVYARRPMRVHADTTLTTPKGSPAKATDATPGDDKAKVSHAPRVRVGRYLPARDEAPGPTWIEVHHYRPENMFNVGPDLTRSILVEIPTPTAGPLAATITLEGDGARAEVEVHARVVEARLPAIPIPVGLLMNALPFDARAVGEGRYRAFEEALLRQQAQAGLNCLTGGAGVGRPLGGRLEDAEPEAAGEPSALTDPNAKPAGPESNAHGDASARPRAEDASSAAYLALARGLGEVRAIVPYGGFIAPLRDDAPLPGKLTEALAAYDVPFYAYAYDEPATGAELAEALALVAPFTAAGVRTLGFTSARRGSSAWDALVAATYAPALATHTGADITRLRAEGRHVWIYNNGLTRFGMGLHLWRGMKLGAEGRLEWIGLFTQGFAFDELDGREASPAAWVVHSSLGPMPTPRWIAAREGLLDLRIRLALEAAVPPGDPALAGWSVEGYKSDEAPLSDEALARARATMLERLAAAAAR
jgi:hypothetical protein